MKTVAIISVMILLLVGGFAVAQTEEEVEALKSNCNSGVLGDCVKVGEWYDSYDFSTRDFRDRSLAAQFFEKACNGGELSGCSHLGNLYELGQGALPKDLTRAVELFRKACDGGVAWGCYRGGALCEHNRQVWDVTLSLELYEKGCDLSSKSACSSAAKVCDPMKGKLKDATRAFVFGHKACDLGDGDTCFRLALYYDTGLFVDKNPDRANELYKKACLSDHKLACEKFKL